MNQRCRYCQWPLPPGEHQCQHCGRWQPPGRRQPDPAEDQPDDEWGSEERGSFEEDPRRARTSGPAYQGGFSWEPAEPPARQRRSLNQPAYPVRQNTLTVKILIVVLAVAVVGLAGGAVAVVLAQGNTPSHGKQAAISTATKQSATLTPSPSPTRTPTEPLCVTPSGPSFTFAGPPTVSLIRDRLLPDNLPLKPVLVDQAPPSVKVITADNFALTVQINRPTAGEMITICKMTLRLVAFTPLANPSPNVQDYCDGVYLNPGGQTGGSCGGGYAWDGNASFLLNSPQVGAEITSPVVNDFGGLGGPGQVTAISDGGGIIQASIKVTAPGTYTFSVGLWQDNTSGPTFSNQAISQMVLVGHMSYYWSGLPCETPDMQALLPPPTNPPGRFICPGTPPQ